jgi:ActR/RegA family two-component response regulator
MVVNLVVKVDLRVMVMAANSDHPTILIVHHEGEFRAALARKLSKNGYLVLEAEDAVGALGIVVRHSRRIHLMLADDSDDGLVKAATLKPYRPDMKIIHVSANLEPHFILMEVSKALE